MQKYTLEIVTQKLLDRHDLKMDVSTFVDIHTPALFIDVEFGKFWRKPQSVIHGAKHQKRYRSRRRTAISIQQQLDVKHNGTVQLDFSTYVHTNKTARFIDIDHGDWYALPYNVLAGMHHPKRGDAIRKAKQTLQRSNIDDIKRQLKNVHGESVKLIDESYVSKSKHAQFDHETYGQWTAIVKNVLRGTSHPAGSHRKTVNKQRKLQSVVHWKTGELCVVQSSYESATLNWLNHNRYDYDWQIPFVTPLLTVKGKNSIYNVDLYIKTGPFKDSYIELKGTWKQRYKSKAITSKQKWDWFKSEHPNSLLWMKTELIALGILT